MGPYLPRPLISPFCGAPRHPAPALAGVGCERVSGTTMETLVDDICDIANDYYYAKQNERKNVYGASEGYPSTGAAASCKAGPAASSSSNHCRPRVGPQARGRVYASGDGDTRTGGRVSERVGGTRRYDYRPGIFVGLNASTSAGGGRDLTTKCHCVFPFRPLRARSASGRTRRGTRPREIRTPRCYRFPIKG